MEDEIARLKQGIDEQKPFIEFAEKLEKLKSNPLFKEIILDDFCNKVIVLNSMLALNSHAKPETREAAKHLADAGATLLSWMQDKEHLGKHAKNYIQEAESVMQSMLADNEGE